MGLQALFRGPQVETADLRSILHGAPSHFVMLYLLQDLPDTAALLDRDNVCQEALLQYARLAADVSTEKKLPALNYAHNHYGQDDVAMFDFTSLYAAEQASTVFERNGHKLLMALVGDSLLEVPTTYYL